MTSAEQEFPVTNVRAAIASRRRKRMWRRLTALARSVFALALLVLLYWLWFASWWAWRGNIQTSGHRLVSRSDILSRLYVPPNRPLYRLDPEWISSQLTSIPAVERVEVRRWLFPARISIKVQERSPMLRIQSVRGNGSYFIDYHGVVFGAASVPIVPRFPVRAFVLEGPGERLAKDQIDALRTLLAYWPVQVVGRVDLRRWQDVYAQIGEWPVRLGRLEQVDLKMALIEHLRPAATRYRGRLRYLDLRFCESPSIVLKSGDTLTPANTSQKQRPSPAPTPEGTPKP